MEQKRLLMAIVISVAILIVFQILVPPPHRPHQQAVLASQSTRATPPEQAPKPTGDITSPGTSPTPAAAPGNAPHLAIDAPRMGGSISLRGARFDDVVLRDYHMTVNPKSPLVRILEPLGDPQPTTIQLGWAQGGGGTLRLPDSSTLWTTDAKALSPGHPATLTWDNGAGLVFTIAISVDANYMFTVAQSVRNTTGAAVALYPWSRVARDYTPVTAGSYLIHEGPIAVLDGRLHEIGYKATKDDGSKSADGDAFTGPSTGGWTGITDKYWLAAVIPPADQALDASFRYIAGSGDDAAGSYQADTIARDPVTIAAGGTATVTSHVFAGAKEVHLLDAYMHDLHIPSFDKAVDFGWFYFLTKPIFFMLDWLNTQLGNFGLAILTFTLFVKALFFPLATKSYKSMSKMRLLAPRMTEIRARHKDDPVAMQRETMALYKSEGVNPASGCLPMLIQIPVFFCLYKVLYVTIEMRHAPFYGWIHDLSEPDPTTIFNLFGLLPFDPGHLTPYLELGIWPLILMGTMVLQQRMNPPPPDPAQARIFQLMPLVFGFMMARFPAGLVIYYCWNNLLTVAQQWYILRHTTLSRRGPKVASS